ncbi:hypothetical protein GE061_014531 [Apolygus lucorum]|uniref:Uncharacterized protein n=1 Tax=Apolygus lucorum TaxID=248454 RepID=A0A8S9XKJ1_APOLU|nr:hypothetical protein GE061_014531 [Apolygus lucorum]
MNGRPRHWLNPNYQRSETEASSCRPDRSRHTSYHDIPSWNSLRTENSMKKVEAKVRSILTCLPKSWAKLNTLTKSWTSLLTSRSEVRDEKEVVMEGVLPTTKASLMSFLKGMGLRPKVELVGRETIISADLSVIHDENLKRRLLDVIKMQVLDTPAATSTNSNFDTPEPSYGSAPEIQGNDKKNHHHFERKRNKSIDSLSAGSSKPDKPRDSLPPGPFKPDKTNGTLPPGPYRTETQMRRDSETRRNSRSQRGELPPGPFLPEHPGEPLPPGPFKPRRSGADDLPPVPWGPKKKQNQDDKDNCSQNGGNNSTNEEQNYGPRKNVSFAMHQKQFSKPDVDIWHHQPSNQGSTNVTKECKKEISNKKPKKLRVIKHIRRWILGSKKVPPAYSPAYRVVENLDDSKALKQTPSEMKGKEIVSENEGNVELSRISGMIIQDCRTTNFDEAAEGKGTVRGAVDLKPVEAFDGSISMPVLIAPDKSCFKTKISKTHGNAEVSKSSTRARGFLEEEPTSYSVVGNSAAIHIAKNRIRLEGKDTKYGSILHKDKHFDDHFKVLQKNSLQDIEHQVNKVKERIMFARAIDSVGLNLSEGAPEVNLKALLWPEKKDFSKKTQVDVVTKSSFYQKFLASMNILKCTNRTDACDRSVMTDEPLSKTYAEFISNTEKMIHKNRIGKNGQKSDKKRPINCERSSASVGDSSCDQPSKSYMTRICQCWEPLLPSKKDQMNHTFRRFEPLRADDERILKCVVNKVIDVSRNKKKGYIKTDIAL